MNQFIVKNEEGKFYNHPDDLSWKDGAFYFANASILYEEEAKAIIEMFKDQGAYHVQV